jgi:hypothetical protein
LIFKHAAFDADEYAPTAAQKVEHDIDPNRPPKPAFDQTQRKDAGKLRFDLIPPEWPRELARVLSFGAAKYEDHGWEKGMEWSRMVASLQRHLNAWLSGEDFDAELGTHHLSQVAWNALALMTYQMRGIGTNNLRRALTK